MTESDLPEVREIDWDNDAIWVQNRTIYLVVDDSDADEIEVQDQRGDHKRLSRKALEQTHFILCDATIYKSRFSPIQAICPGPACQVRAMAGSAETIDVPAGHAVLRSADGKLSVVPRHEFDCAYAIVSGAHPTAPSI